MYGTRLKVTTDEGTYEVPVTTAVEIAWEDHHKVGGFHHLFDQRTVKQLAWLAWEATRRSGTTVPQFDKFTDTLVKVEFVSDDGPKG